jgi:hypothetical protein
VWEDQHVRAKNEEDAQDIVLTLRIFTKAPASAYAFRFCSMLWASALYVQESRCTYNSQ